MSYTQQDINLMNTQFDEETEKTAAAQVAAIHEAYDYGFSKLAKDSADEKDKEDKEEEDKEEEKKEKKMDGESEKAAAELGAFIERGFFDGLRKLGSERFGDEGHYIEPLVMDKIAGIGESASKAWAATKGGAGKAWETTKQYHRNLGEDVRRVVKGVKDLPPHETMGTVSVPLTKMQRAGSAGKAALRVSPYAALAGGGIYGASKALGGKDEAQQ